MIWDDRTTAAGTTEPTIPDNSVIEAACSARALNLDYPGLAAVKANESDQYYLAAQALLEYYRGRTDVVNGNVNLIAPSISATRTGVGRSGAPRQRVSFYVEGYMDGDVPHSYLEIPGR